MIYDTIRCLEETLIGRQQVVDIQPRLQHTLLEHLIATNPVKERLVFNQAIKESAHIPTVLPI